ncbi:MAG: hypothetical protein ACI9P9_000814 [Patescibacteria group bacterium]|jgi:hypothetical protein
MEKMDLVGMIKEKREFSVLPDSVVLRAIAEVDSDLDSKYIVKEARAHLRKYFGVFLTNRVLKPKDILDFDSVLKSHKSSAKRDYSVLYSRLAEVISDVGKIGSVFDLGCGMNGFSYSYLREVFGDVEYVGLEASGQLVGHMKNYFLDKKFHADAHVVDLFELDFSIFDSGDRARVAFLFQVVDAMEHEVRDSSKELLLKMKEKVDCIIVSMPMTASLSGGRETKVTRKWLGEFLEEHFEILDDFEMFEERFFCVRC